MSEWKYTGAVAEGEPFELDGLDVWKNTWRDTGGKAQVTDPHHQQPFEFSVYEITVGAKSVTFAAGEFSNCIWGFFLPRRSPGATGRRIIVDPKKSAEKSKR